MKVICAAGADQVSALHLGVSVRSDRKRNFLNASYQINHEIHETHKSLKRFYSALNSSFDEWAYQGN